MKPLQLQMSAWGSYKEVVTIDFTKFRDGSLFLITGPTGAGKTTVFDAITFALYGDVSGKIREKSSVRSDFANVEMDTYVELVFSHKNQIYTIKRSPKYERPKKRGTGFTTSNETAEFYEKEHSPITVIAEVNKKVEELLGINYAQFKQIAMIAQGEFLEVLVSNSRDRVEILRNLFRTGQYEQIQKELSLKANKLYQNNMELKNKIDEAISSIDVIEKEELSMLLEAENFRYDTIIDQTKQYIKEEKTKIKNYEKQIEELEVKSKEQIIQITEGEALNKTIKDFTYLSNEILELEQKQNTIAQDEERVKNAYQTNKVLLQERLYLDAKKRMVDITNKLSALKEEIDKLEPSYESSKIEYEKNEIRSEKILEYQERYRKLEEFVPLLKELGDIEKDLKQYLEALNMNVKQIEDKKLQLKDSIQQRQLLSEEWNKFSDLEERLTEHKLKTVNYEQKYLDRKEAFQKTEVLEIEKKNLYKQQELYTNSEREVKRLKEDYEKKEELYKGAAVGLAARYLVDDMPCPVCGSIEHPKKATISHDIPDEKELENLKRAYEKAQTIHQKNYLTAAEQNGMVSSKETELNLLYERLQVKNKEELVHNIDEIRSILDTLSKERKELEENLTKKDAMKNQIAKLDSSIDTIRNEVEQLQNNNQETKSKFDQLQGEKTQILVKLPKDKTMLDLTNEMDVLKDEIVKEQEINRQAEMNYQRIKRDLEQNNTLYQDTKVQYNQLAEQEKEKEAAFSEELRNNGFLSEEAYQQAKITESELVSLEKTIKDYYEIKQAKVEQAKKISQLIHGREEVDVLLLQKQLEEIDGEKALIRKEKEKVTARIQNNERAVLSIHSKLVIKKELEEEYGIIRDLDNVTKGNNKERLVFEQYVLSSYFEDIIASANLRLAKMTNGRYELMKVSKVADARTKDSLDLEVLDYYTGKIRSIKTLSGGESFKAALSLALGLSDVVQNNAGGIEIETLFIDEGFGSLDSESLDQALNTLNSLTEHNHMIGIISHVNELKDRIENQIVVEKGNQGSGLRLVY